MVDQMEEGWFAGRERERERENEREGQGWGGEGGSETRGERKGGWEGGRQEAEGRAKEGGSDRQKHRDTETEAGRASERAQKPLAAGVQRRVPRAGPLPPRPPLQRRVADPGGDLGRHRQASAGLFR